MREYTEQEQIRREKLKTLNFGGKNERSLICNN